MSAIWSPKALDNLVDLELDFNVEVEAAVLRRLGKTQDDGYVLAPLSRSVLCSVLMTDDGGV